jgi:hypothetical protein
MEQDPGGKGLNPVAVAAGVVAAVGAAPDRAATASAPTAVRRLPTSREPRASSKNVPNAARR